MPKRARTLFWSPRGAELSTAAVAPIVRGLDGYAELPTTDFETLTLERSTRIRNEGRVYLDFDSETGNDPTTVSLLVPGEAPTDIGVRICRKER